MDQFIFSGRQFSSWHSKYVQKVTKIERKKGESYKNEKKGYINQENWLTLILNIIEGI
jgi:hypothetical protein